MAKSASPIRLQQDLMDAASVAGEQMHRSTAEQIEYWADLGRRVADILDPLKLADITAGIATLKVESSVAPPVAPDAVFARLAEARAQGGLAEAVTTTYPRYQAAPGHPGYLEQITFEGQRTIGTFENGEFKPLAPST